jgi:hypothetical protein
MTCTAPEPCDCSTCHRIVVHAISEQLRRVPGTVRLGVVREALVRAATFSKGT